ncbi:MAG: hypothetical protein OHK0048_06820 [Rhodoferax sp.]
MKPVRIPRFGRPGCWPGGLWRAVGLAMMWVLGSAALAQTHRVVVPTELRAAPALNAQPLVRLLKDALVTQTGQKVGWIRVTAPGLPDGWVRSTHLQALAPQPSAPGANPLTALGGMFTATTNRPTATNGTRGLTPEQLAQAQPNPAEVSRLESYAVAPGQAQQFARSGKLVSRRIDDEGTR